MGKESNTAQADTPTDGFTAAHNALVERVSVLEDLVGTHYEDIVRIMANLAGESAKDNPATTPVKGKAAPKGKGKVAPVSQPLRNPPTDLATVKYACSCGGWGLAASFETKHVGKHKGKEADHVVSPYTP